MYSSHVHKQHDKFFDGAYDAVSAQGGKRKLKTCSCASSFCVALTVSTLSSSRTVSLLSRTTVSDPMDAHDKNKCNGNENANVPHPQCMHFMKEATHRSKPSSSTPAQVSYATCNHRHTIVAISLTDYTVFHIIHMHFASVLAYPRRCHPPCRQGHPCRWFDIPSTKLLAARKRERMQGHSHTIARPVRCMCAPFVQLICLDA